MKTLHRQLAPETRVLDAAQGLVEYVASDQTLDSYDEIILAKGWSFAARFRTNPVFVDSHSYYGIDKVLGRVVDMRVDGDQLIEVVKWATDVSENKLAQLGFQMTEKGYLKAVSVGFIPTKWCRRSDDEFTSVADTISGLAQGDRDRLRCIYQEQEQIELSACVIGANPSALAKAYHSGDIAEEYFARCGLDDDRMEDVSLAARAWEENESPATRELVVRNFQFLLSNQLRENQPNDAGSQTRSPGPSTTGRRSTVEDRQRSESERRRRWLKQVAESLGD